MSEDIKDKSIDKMTDLTDGLCMSEILSLALISKREKISIADEKGVKNVIDKYKFGDVESHWQKDILKEKLNENENIFVRRVKGQMPAIRAVLDIIKRASMGLSGVQHSSGSSKPRGILFFAGPTGVGKTELAKTLAAVLFGDAERSFHRFDMSEYSLEHADQKLMGAPPGYLGYDAGGQLTNFIKERPFSVLLFDEIEKAHPSVLDKFLQILEDGRMTDGKGETVYFSESILVFTSNLGAYVDVTLENGRVMRQVNIYPMCWACTKCNDQKAIDVSGVKPGKCAKCGCTDLEHKETPYSVIKSRIKEAINDHFKFRLGRPELLNRFGNNFVIFDYIRKPVMEEIIEDILEHNIKDEIRVKHGVNLIFSDKVKKWLLDRACQNIEHGGRGVGNLIETSIVNPLARKMFDMESIQKIKEIHISAVIENIESEEFDIHMEIK